MSFRHRLLDDAEMLASFQGWTEEVYRDFFDLQRGAMSDEEFNEKYHWERAILSMGCDDYPEIEHRLQQGIDQPVAPKYVETAKHKQVITLGDDVDLYRLPIPMSSIYDGGPMITAGIVIAKDPEYGFNSGMYRFMVKEKNLTGIDIVTPNNMRLFAHRA